VALLSGRNFEAKTYEEEIAAKSFESLKHGVLDFMNETNFRRFLMIIKSAGYIDSSLIRSQAPLNFAYALYLKLRGEGYKSDDVERYTRRWFVLSFITSRYTASAETRFEEDIRAIDEQGFGEYLKRTEEAELSETFWNVGLVQALATSNSNHPAFNTFLASQARDNIRGFLSNSITVRSMLEHRGDMHHVFPRDYLKKKLGLRKSEYNQVANYVYTQQEINIAVGNQPPQSYMAAVRKQCKGGPLIYGAIADLDELERNLEENALPAMLIEDAVPEYEDFLSARRKLMAARLRDYYRSL
jgi:hypothetical protein